MPRHPLRRFEQHLEELGYSCDLGSDEVLMVAHPRFGQFSMGLVREGLQLVAIINVPGEGTEGFVDWLLTLNEFNRLSRITRASLILVGESALMVTARALAPARYDRAVFQAIHDAWLEDLGQIGAVAREWQDTKASPEDTA